MNYYGTRRVERTTVIRSAEGGAVTIDELRRWLDMAACARMEREESRRTIVVPSADLAVQVEAMAVMAGAPDLFTVRVSQVCPPDSVLVFDEQAIEAGTREALLRHRSRF